MEKLKIIISTKTLLYKINAVLLSIILNCGLSTAQSYIPPLGTVPIQHYSQKDYKSASQFWCATQNKDGIMFFGNNYGIISFDGAQWHEITLPNNSAARSMITDKNNTIYAGGFNEFGIIEQCKTKGYLYQSFTSMLPSEHQNFENIWDIHEINSKIIFRSFSHLFVLNNNEFRFIESDENFIYSGVSNEMLFIVDNNILKTLDTNTMEFSSTLPLSELNHEQIIHLYPGTQTTEVMVITRQGSLFKIDLRYKTSKQIETIETEDFKPPYITASKINQTEILIGSLSHKMHSWQIVNDRLKPINHYNKLQDNTVLDIFKSIEGTIWIMMDKGLDHLDPNADLTTIFEGSSVYDAIIFENYLYIATNEGVFKSLEKLSKNPVKQLEFKSIQGLEGQAWSLQNINDQLFCSHDHGLFKISGTDINQIDNNSGIWKLYQTSKNNNIYFICRYNGLGLIEINNEEINIMEVTLPGFYESTRDISKIGDEKYWICHGYKGVYKIETNPASTRVIAVNHFNEQDGLPSIYNINVHKWKEKNIFTTNHGIYYFNSSTQEFTIHKQLTSLLGDEENIRQIIDQGDITWFVKNDEIGYFKNKNPDKYITEPFKTLKGSLNRGLECIIALNKSDALFGTSYGLYAYQPSLTTSNDSSLIPQTVIQKIKYSVNDSVYQYHHFNNNNHIEIPHNAANIEIRFSAPFIKDKGNIQYSYILEGHSINWNDWQNENSVTYPQLNSDEYNLKVRARSLSGEIAKSVQINITVLPVWYATRGFMILWAVTGIIVLNLLILLVSIIIKKEKAKTKLQEKKHQRTLEIELEKIKLEREKEIITKDKNKLESDVITKSKDLANYTLSLAKNRELLINIKDNLNSIRKIAKNDKVRKELLNSIQNITITINNQKQFQLFETNLERVHNQLFNQLKNNFPDITQKDLKLCAFIKMELTNKEIASIFNITTRGVESAKYRLKKNYPEIINIIEKSKEGITDL
ncbi:hypothetical protein QA597_07740 [Marinilabiliaceae bacterium ANBcel2]|nr:hypothetical protein [Marinilabiliaceae bacterium ANBcel2]